MSSERDDPPVESPATVVETETGESVAAAVLRATATVTGTGRTDLPPLYDSIDPDALERVVRTVDPGGSVVFPYDAFRIAVSGGGTVEVYEDAR